MEDRRMDFDARRDNDPDHYVAFVAELVRSTSSLMKSAEGDSTLIRSAVEQYLLRGYGAGLTSGELTDFFCVDTPSLLDWAGFSEADGAKAVEIFDELNSVYRRDGAG